MIGPCISSLFALTNENRFSLATKFMRRSPFFAKRAETSFNVAVGRYVIMPDHIHLFVRGADDFRLGRSPETGFGKGSQTASSENAPMAGRIFRSRFKKQRGLCTKMELRS